MTTSILSQEVHQKRVASVYRLCAGKSKTSQGYCTIKSVREYLINIYNIFNYDISNDKTEVHPAIICGSCRRKLELNCIQLELNSAAMKKNTSNIYLKKE